MNTPHPDLRDLAAPVADLLGDYLTEARAGNGPVIRDRPLREVHEELDWRRWVDRGGMGSAELAAFLARFLGATTRLHHPHFLAHQVAVPDEFAALADWVNGTVNNGMAIYEMGPPGVALELGMVRWMLDKVGWQDGEGILTHGGSLANLTCMLAARAKIAPDAWQTGTPPDLVVLAPASSHYSVARAIGILGLGIDSVVPLPTDDLGTVRASEVAPTIDRVTAEGKRVMAVALSACATATGLHDPIAEIAPLCRERGIWCHVDGAHGASALLSPELRSRLAGIDQADSTVWDAHKMLRTSVLCAAALFRDPGSARRAFEQKASYFSDVDPERDNRFEKAVECTKNGLGLKLFLVLARHGEQGLRSHVETLYARTHEFYELLSSRTGFECPYAPESNILCFRYGNHDQEALRRALVDEGSYYLTGTDIGGRRFLRMSVMNPLSDRSVVEGMAARIEALAAR